MSRAERIELCEAVMRLESAKNDSGPNPVISTRIKDGRILVSPFDTPTTALEPEDCFTIRPDSMDMLSSLPPILSLHVALHETEPHTGGTVVQAAPAHVSVLSRTPFGSKPSCEVRLPYRTASGIVERHIPVVTHVPQIDQAYTLAAEILTRSRSAVVSGVGALSYSENLQRSLKLTIELEEAAKLQFMSNTIAEHAPEFESVAKLSSRELSVLIFAANGLENEQIARELDCSEFAVLALIDGIAQKLGAKNLLHAIAIATKHNYI